MSSEARPASPTYAWYVVAVLLLAYTLSFIDRMILSLLVGPIKADLGISDTQMSLLMGFAFAIFYSALGIPLGWLADRLYRRGFKDAHLRVIRLNAILLAPLFVGMALAPSAPLALGLMIVAMLVGTIHGGVAGAALQMITPNRLRARMVALYFLVANLIGLGLGPTAIALVTDLGFGRPEALRYGLAIVTAVALPISAVILTAGLKPFARAVEAAEQNA